MNEERVWAVRGPIVGRCKEHTERNLASYKANPDLLEEHFNIERDVAEGGYGRRQIYELVQNGADEIGRSGQPGRIEIVINASHLYCANEGLPFDEDGIRTLLGSHLSNKRSDEIGRFGLGFKSVLAVTDSPEIFSTSGSFRFDPAASKQRIREVAKNAVATPTLRLTFPVDVYLERSNDSTLASLMEWASTIIRLPLNQEGARSLPNDLAEFPSEFILFSPHVNNLRLRNDSTGFDRTISLGRTGDTTILRISEGGSLETSRWLVSTAEHFVSKEAGLDAGRLSRRDRVQLTWAAPSSTQARGRYWAFFPTTYITTVSGILNSGWKTNNDRQNLLEGRFNEELLGAAAQLVVESLPGLSMSDDPGKCLAYLPARSQDAPNWADRHLSSEVLRRATTAEAVPDLSGVLRKVTEVLLHPQAVDVRHIENWASVPGAPVNWCHPTAVVNKERKSALHRIADEAGQRETSISEWLEALSRVGTPSAALGALQICADLKDEGALGWNSAKILPTKGGPFVEPVSGRVFVGSGDGSGTPMVAPELLDLEGASELLQRLGITTFGAASKLGNLLSLRESTDDTHTEIWKHIRLLSIAKAEAVLGAARAFPMVRNRAGNWCHPSSVLLPGEVVVAGEDDDVAVDTAFHSEDLEILNSIGVVARPSVRDVPIGSWFANIESQEFSRLRRSASAKGRRPRSANFQFETTPCVEPLDVLGLLGLDGRLQFTEVVVARCDELPSWKFGHKTDRSWDVLEIENPVWPALRTDGVLRTSLGPEPVGTAVGPGLKQFMDVLPVASVSDAVAQLLGLPQELTEIKESHWIAAYAAVAEEVAQRFGKLLEMQLDAGSQLPTELPFSDGTSSVRFQLTDFLLCSDAESASYCESEGLPCLLIKRDEVRQTLTAVGCETQEPAHVIGARALGSVKSDLLVDRYPALAPFGAAASMTISNCENVELEQTSPSGLKRRSTSQYVFDDVVYLPHDLDAPEELRALAQILKLGLSDSEIEALLDERSRADEVRFRRSVQKAETLHEKIALILGEEAVRSSAPAALLAHLEEDSPLTIESLVGLALAVHGYELLNLHKDLIQERGLRPPGQWTGRKSGREWARSLGLPAEFAGFPNAGRDATIDVEGPTQLPLLHGYQSKIVAGIKRLIASGKGAAMVSLPTGAGKTRVATTAVVEALKERLVTGPVLWVAQTDELCEQAVESWKQAWSSGGTSDTLQIGRLWSTRQVSSYDGPQVVVATIAKLNELFDENEYEWLRGAAVVVVDEAHRAIGSSYDRLVGWLGMADSPGAPLVGLTATPFRGTNSVETSRLIRRFGNERLDRLGELGDDPYLRLQDEGVLAKVEFRELLGSDYELTDDELRDLKQMHRLPASVEAKVGNDRDRNERIVESLMGLGDDKTALVFAASVDHARYLAGLLSFFGIPAKSVSAETKPAARRHYIDQFRSGDLRVLTNYGVLQEGFDAPAVSAVYVTRPTYSPGVYQQMIGRGLRGPRNGGKESCLVVNVADNISQYGERLAFREFEHMWGRGGGTDAD